MTAGDFFEGMALFALVGAAAALVAVRVTGARLGHLDALERALAGALLFLAAVLAIHLVPLLLGVLSRGTVIAAAALAAVATLALPFRPPAGRDAPRPEAPASSRASWVLATLTAAAVLVAAAAATRHWLPVVFSGIDITTFHLPNAARWIETGSLWQVDAFGPRAPHGYYPNSGELLYVWALLPFDNDFLVRWVIVPLLGLWALAAFAVVRELGGAPAAGVLAACMLVAIPITGKGTIPNALPDVLLYTTMTIGALFLLRHRRSGRRSDLVLAGLGLGIGLGTKWYGLSTAVIVIAVWAAARLLRDRGAWRVALRDVALTGGVAIVAGGVWFVRNLIESGNPLFPVRASVFGITLFDAPPDLVRERVGFTIADYLADPDVLFGRLPAEIVEGAGLAAPAAVVLAVAAALVARRARTSRGPVLALCAAAALLAGAYAVTPYSALGAESEPILANFNTRYLVPALTAAVLAGAWVAGRTRLGLALEALLAAVALISLGGAYAPLSAGTFVKTAVALSTLGGVAALVWRVGRSRSPALRRGLAFGAASAVAIGAVAYADRSEGRFNDRRYAAFEEPIATIQQLSAGGPLRVGLAGSFSIHGLSPVWPSFGPRMQNQVAYVGRDEDGWLVPYESERSFTAALRRGRYDLLVLGLGAAPRPHVREEVWARAAAYVELDRSERMTVWASPALAARSP